MTKTLFSIATLLIIVGVFLTNKDDYGTSLILSGAIIVMSINIYKGFLK